MSTAYYMHHNNSDTNCNYTSCHRQLCTMLLYKAGHSKVWYTGYNFWSTIVDTCGN